MYAKILVPLDGSKTAENVVPLARSFARGLQIPVELLGVVDDDPQHSRRRDPKI